MKKRLSVEEGKKLALQGLVRFREICEEYGLRYYLGCGTLLGCIRHKGFIPWDDDIDVLMPREDYDKLILLSDKVENSDWKLMSHEIDKNYLRPWMKLTNKHTVLYPERFNSGLTYGVMIDIFPLDYISANNIDEAKEKAHAAQDEYFRAMKKLQPICVTRTGPKMVFKRIIKKTYYQIYGKRKVNFTDELSKLKGCAQKERTDYITVLCGLCYAAIFPTESIINDVDKAVGMFENELFSIPFNSHDYLTACYGDYMILPPKEKQVSDHHGAAYWLKEKDSNGK